MAAGNLTKTELAAWIPTLWVREGLRKFVGNLIVGKLVNRDYKDEFKNFGDTINVRKPLSFDVNDKTANTAVTYQAVTAQNASMTLNKYKEVSFVGEDVAVIEAMTGAWEQILGDAMADVAVQVDKDLIAEAANFTGDTVGVQGTADTFATVRAARKSLNDSNLPAGASKFAVIGTQTASDLLGQDIFVQAQQRGSSAPLTDGEIGTVLNIQFHESTYVDRTGDTPGDQNLVFSPAALTLATRPLPLPEEGSGAKGAYGDYDGVSMRIVKGWSQDHQAMTVVITTLYGPKAIRPEFGLVMLGK